jgi:glutamate-ammonia-ligase adenylyltransferase
MSGFRLPSVWPRAADRDAAEALALALRAPEADTPAIPRASEIDAMLNCLGGNSAFLSDLARRERAFLALLIRHGPARATATALRRLRTLSPETARADIASGLRRAKRQVALAVAVADLGGLWTLEQVTGALSLLAEAALRVATAHLLAAARRDAGLRRTGGARRPEQGSGFVVLAMGKLGAQELNYSSDVDLMLLYDPAMQDGVPELGRVFVRMAADLVSLMEARDADGYVFRMDLRLRPDPGATPPAVSVPAAIAYYESYGQTWERAAMTKARPVAGDLACGARFLDAIRPFVWRRHLDFAAIEDIHAMKRRIDRHKPSPAKRFGARLSGLHDPVEALLGHDLKLGHGGIREIEFVAQTLQLVWGGREPALRDPGTLGALQRLAAGGYLNRATARSLAQTYRRLRSLEHRLQMQADRQTHSLPATRTGFEAFAVFAGATDGAALARSLLPELRRTRRRFERMARSQVVAPDAAAGPGPWGAREAATAAPEGFDGPDGEVRLRALGFPDNARVRDILRGWQTDRYRALRQPRARALLEGLMPTLLRALGGQRDPLGALVRFDTLLSRQGSGVQLLSLFDRSPPLLDRIAAVLGAAPSLADHLAAVPGALDGLLVTEPDRQAGRVVLGILDRQMRAAGGVDEAIRIARGLVRGEEFRLSVAQMEGRMDVDAAGIARTALAEHVIIGMLRHVGADHRRRYGTVRGGGLSVVALGKAGSREMMSGSDLDLMLVYDHPDDVFESVPGRAGGGRLARPLAPSQYYTRLAHGLIAALSAPGLEGPLYALDMRLRPSGNKGPVAVSLAAFRRYHAEQAWTWERMALARARVVAGPAPLRRRVAEAIAIGLSTVPHAAGDAVPPDPAAQMRRDAAAMRARLARDLPPQGPWDVKLRAGGLMEVEFIAQILQLASSDPVVRHPTTRIALRRLARTGGLARADAATLIAADRFWRELQGMLRILLGVQIPRDLRRSLPLAVVEALLRGMSRDADRLGREPGPGSVSVSGPGPGPGPGPEPGLDALEARCEVVSASVRSAFLRLVGPIPDA